MNLSFDEYKQRELMLARAKSVSTTVRRGWDWRSVGAIFGLSAGLISIILGTTLTALSWLLQPESSYIQAVGTVLLALTIPLLIFGAHCLDLLERRKNQKKESRSDDRI